MSCHTVISAPLKDICNYWPFYGVVDLYVEFIEHYLPFKVKSLNIQIVPFVIKYNLRYIHLTNLKLNLLKKIYAEYLLFSLKFEQFSHQALELSSRS